MHIVLLDSKPLDREWLRGFLKSCFKDVQISEFACVADFLDSLPSISAVDLLILEHFLALLQPTPDTEFKMKVLETVFPKIASGWDHQEAAERVIRHVREVGLNFPIIIYTDSDEEWVQEDVRTDPKVTFCQKEGEKNNLVCALKLIFSK
jgi:hypothetical protein